MEHLHCYLLLASFNEILKSTDVMDFIISLFFQKQTELFCQRRGLNGGIICKCNGKPICSREVFFLPELYYAF